MGRTVKPQDIYRVLRSCIAPASIGYLIRTTPPGLICRQAALFDDATFQCILDILKSPPLGTRLESDLFQWHAHRRNRSSQRLRGRSRRH